MLVKMMCSESQACCWKGHPTALAQTLHHHWDTGGANGGPGALGDANLKVSGKGGVNS